MRLPARALLLVVAVGVLLPAAAVAQTGGLPSRSARARFGADGGSVTLANVRLVVPPGASGGAGFAALGVGGVPAPWGLTEPVGETGILVSVSPPPRGAVLLEILPTATDVAASGGDTARLMLVDASAQGQYGCQPRAELLLCPIPGPGLYVLAAAREPSVPLLDPATLQYADAGEKRRIVVSLMAGLGVAVVLLATFAICSRLPLSYVGWPVNGRRK